jgi:hypothetical protein
MDYGGLPGDSSIRLGWPLNYWGSNHLTSVARTGKFAISLGFKSVKQRKHQLQSRMNEKSALYKRGLSLQFDDLFGKVARS